MAIVIYLLCAIASTFCVALLLRSWQASRNRLLLWCCLCFVGLALNNIFLFVDLMIGSLADLSTLRAWLAFFGFGTLAYGLIWETV